MAGSRVVKSSNAIVKKLRTESGGKYIKNSLSSSENSLDVSCEGTHKILPMVSEDKVVE